MHISGRPLYVKTVPKELPHSLFLKPNYPNGKAFIKSDKFLGKRKKLNENTEDASEGLQRIIRGLDIESSGFGSKFGPSGLEFDKRYFNRFSTPWLFKPFLSGHEVLHVDKTKKGRSLKVDDDHQEEDSKEESPSKVTDSPNINENEEKRNAKFKIWPRNPFWNPMIQHFRVLAASRATKRAGNLQPFDARRLRLLKKDTRNLKPESYFWNSLLMKELLTDNLNGIKTFNGKLYPDDNMSVVRMKKTLPFFIVH